MIKFVETDEFKFARSPEYNFNFNKENGYFERWGKTYQDYPQFSPYGPEILDCEVTTRCNGIRGKLCSFCYKSNTPNGINMSFDTFKTILDKMPRTLGQVAFGADSMGTSNPDLFKMMEYCRYKEIVPNITIADITDETADTLARLCGAVAVSSYDDKNVCYDTVKKLTDRGMTQVNIHKMVSSETFEQTKEIIKDRLIDPRLSKMNAIVYLSLKKKGRGETFHSLTQEQFKEIVDLSFESKINFGFDSCSCHRFLNAVAGRENYKQLSQSAEPCESSAMSAYFSVDAKFHPCSFCGEDKEFGEGLDVVNCKDFIQDIWNNPKTIKFRDHLLKCGRSCPIYNI